MTDPHEVVKAGFSLTQEVLLRLDAEGGNKSALVEQLLREHFGMAPRPALDKGGRKPRAPKEQQSR